MSDSPSVTPDGIDSATTHELLAQLIAKVDGLRESVDGLRLDNDKAHAVMQANLDLVVIDEKERNTRMASLEDKVTRLQDGLRRSNGRLRALGDNGQS